MGPGWDTSASAELEQVAGRALNIDVIGGGHGGGFGVEELRKDGSGTADRSGRVECMLLENSSILGSLGGLDGKLDTLADGKSGVVLVPGEEAVTEFSGHTRR